jgi:hypothetical protein
MTHSKLLGTIRKMPLANQMAIAEAIMHDLGNQLKRRRENRKLFLRKIRKAAMAANQYYRNDPEVALWRGLDGEN